MDLRGRPGLGSPVIIVQVRSHSPDSGAFQFSRETDKGERRLSFMAKSERQLWSGGFCAIRRIRPLGSSNAVS
jgi:hypothetical protein